MRQLLVIALLLGGVSSAHAEEIRVLTAGSLKGVLGAIAAQFEQGHNAHVTLIGGRPARSAIGSSAAKPLTFTPPRLFLRRNH